MNDQDKKILELYLKDVRKKKIIFLTIVVSIITSVLLYGLYEKYKKNTNNEQNYIESNVEENVSNENSIEETNLNTENKIIVENTEKTEDNTSLIVKEDTKQDSKEENKKIHRILTYQITIKIQKQSQQIKIFYLQMDTQWKT